MPPFLPRLTPLGIADIRGMIVVPWYVLVDGESLVVVVGVVGVVVGLVVVVGRVPVAC